MTTEGAVPGSALPIAIHDLLYYRGVEAARVELKSSWNEGPTAQQVLETICAFQWRLRCPRLTGARFEFDEGRA